MTNQPLAEPTSIGGANSFSRAMLTTGMGTRSQRDSADETISLTHEGDWYVATDETTGIASQGETKAAALENLAEALELHDRPVDDGDKPDPSTAPWFSG